MIFLAISTHDCVYVQYVCFCKMCIINFVCIYATKKSSVQLKLIETDVPSVSHVFNCTHLVADALFFYAVME